jgi:AraC-like DNA-binding protein
MEQAKGLMAGTNKSIGQIARLAGYDTVAGFIHAFRREFGLIPRQCRIAKQKNEHETPRKYAVLNKQPAEQVGVIDSPGIINRHFRDRRDFHPVPMV